MMSSRHLAFVGLGLAMAAATSSQAELIYGMTAAGSASDLGGIGLVSFDSASPGSRSFHGNFTGVMNGHSIRSIDFRPATGEL